MGLCSGNVGYLQQQTAVAGHGIGFTKLPMHAFQAIICLRSNKEPGCNAMCV
jgi:hypothetical protein